MENTTDFDHRMTVEERPFCWASMQLAPRDGRPIWAKGFNFGDTSGSRGTHCTWAYWDGTAWKEAGSASQVRLEHLFEYMPLKLDSAVRVIPI